MPEIQTLDAAIERAARELPIGYTVRLEVEAGSAWVVVECPNGTTLPVGEAFPDYTLAEQIGIAIQSAEQHATLGTD